MGKKSYWFHFVNRSSDVVFICDATDIVNLECAPVYLVFNRKFAEGFERGCLNSGLADISGYFSRSVGTGCCFKQTITIILVGFAVQFFYRMWSGIATYFLVL